ncbi:MAG: alpha-glucosidase [Erysipelotrichaceae bacterium]|nr:alpha-glucosidase [Erysipelotrichaceae bacterium]
MKTEWYKNAVIYQIYPFSFLDRNNDGWGDIEGIISKLDYIKDLGVTAIWFSPLYKSPDYDYGYDIADYKEIDEKFGTMADFDRLLKECHKRDLKVIMDMVINHTSTEHEWFKKAIGSPDSPFRDYYIIRKGRKEKGKLLPPTNWQSVFTGSAWERIGDSEDFYLHLFCREQADLNWENERVREEIIDILKFWLDKGVDGFRFDVFNMFSKVYPLQDDNDKGGVQKGDRYFIDGPRMHEFLKELNEKALALYDSYTVGESYHPSRENALAYVKEENRELDSIFDFAHLDSDNIAGQKFFWKPFDLRQFKKGLFDPQRDNYGLGWNTLVLENHDNPRSVSRFGIDTKNYRYEAATMLATVTYLGFGIPYIYMGQEAGFTNCKFSNIEEMKDPVSHFVYDLMTHYGMPKKLAFSFIKYGARDHARVPIAWNDSVNGGFNKGKEPWQKINPNYKVINIETDLKSDKSVYRYFRKLLGIKKNDPAAVYGKTEEYDHENKKVVAYSREHEGHRLFVLANFSKKPISWQLPEWVKDGEVLINNYPQLDRDGLTVRLQPYQSAVIRAKSII